MIKNLIIRAIDKLAEKKYALQFNPKFEVKNNDYSNFFKNMMNEKRLYTVHLSTLPENFMDIEYPHEEPHVCCGPIGPSLHGLVNHNVHCFFDDNTPNSNRVAKIFWYDSYTKAGLSDIALKYLANQMIDKNVLVVETGESPEYVKEILTGIKIPILYYFTKHQTMITSIKYCIIKEYKEKRFGKHISYPYYIKMLETLVEGHHYFTNFKDENCLNSLSEEERKTVLEFYKNMHSDIELYKEELSNYFKKCEEETENAKELHKQHWIEEYKQNAYSKLPKVLVKK